MAVVGRGLGWWRLCFRLRVAVDPQDDARSLAFELDRVSARALDLRAGLEPTEHPADRRRLVGGTAPVDRARDDQPIDRARHGDVVETQTLGPLLGFACLPHCVIGVGAATLARDRIGDAEAEPSIGQGKDLVRGRRRLVAAGVGDDHDLELEPSGRVNRQQADRVATFLLRHRFELASADGFLVADETHETLDIRAAQLLVGAREPCELAQIRVPPPAVPLRQDRKVVVVLRDDALAEPLERKPPHGGRQAVETLPEGPHELRVTLGQRLRKLTLERDEERPLRGRAAQQHERIVGDPDER